MRGTFATAVAALLLAFASVNLTRAGEAERASARPRGPSLGFVQIYCQRCHNDRVRSGHLQLTDFDVATAALTPESVARTEADHPQAQGQHDAAPRGSASL